MNDLPEGLLRGEDGRVRCAWQQNLPDYAHYHDHEWGRPVRDDVRLFEKLCLEGFQSGLSWLTILRKREHFRAAFAGFDPVRVARFDEADVKRLLADAGIVRHRGKIEATINNAARVLEVQREFGSFADYIWGFEPPASERPTRFDWASLRQLAQSPSSLKLSKDLRRRGFRFVGPTTCYAFMQAMGLVNDHVEGCGWR
jgi:DNA-3-methyladenine glycosylase I